jgi:hypothetical protein
MPALSLIGAVGAAVALPGVLLLGGVANADNSVSAGQLTDVVPTVKDVKVFYKNATSDQAPLAGTGVDHIPSQGICVKSNGTYATLKKLPKRQAWSAQRIGDGEGRGLISIVGQYKSVQAAKNKFAKVVNLLGGCPATVTTGVASYKQGYASLAKMYKGQAVATTLTTSRLDEPDSVQYVAIRQTGAQLAFVRYAQQFETTPPSPTQYTGMVTYLSGVVAARYHALAQ